MSYIHFVRNESARLGLALVIVALVSGLVLLRQSQSGASHAAISERLAAAGRRPALAAGSVPGLTSVAETDPNNQLRAIEAYAKLPLSFEVNQGQTDAHVKFLSRGAGYNLFLTSTEAVLSLERNRGARETQARGGKGSARATTDVLRMKLVGANPAPTIEGSDQLPGKSNYFIGNNPKSWRVNVSNFGRVSYRGIYPGVDVVYYGNQRQLENDFVVSPRVDPKVINLAFDGAKKISTDEAGNLVLETASGQVQLQKPVAYQEVDGSRHEIAVRYTLLDAGPSLGDRQLPGGNRFVGFEVAAYDHSVALVIDPVVVFSSSILDASGADTANSITVDASGNAYVTGNTASANFPTVNPIQASLNGTQDAFVSKFNAAGSALIYSTYLGGSAGFENGWDIAVDSANNAYVAGRTTSTDFPVTAATAFQPTKSTNNTIDAGFVTRLSATGALFYSTYLTGPQGSNAFGIATDGAGNAYVTGRTGTGFPVTASAFSSTTFNTGFLTKLNTNASGAASLVYSTFLGPTGFAEGHAIAADATGNVYITGNVNSTSTNFTSAGAFQTTFGGGTADAFVAKFNTNLSGAASRIYSTYLGGNGQDFGGSSTPRGGKAIAIDSGGNAYITGMTTSTNFPTANAFQPNNGGNADAFLTKLNATGSALVYSTYFGGNGSNNDEGTAVAVNVLGNAYVAGLTNSANFPTAFPLATADGTTGGAFLAKFTPSGTPLVYSTRFGQAADQGLGVALDGAGNAFVTTGRASATFVTEIADPTIIGRVVDEDNNPIAGATVNLTGVPSATTSTDANGYFTFGLLTVANNYTVSVVVPNYIFNSQTVNNLVKNVRLDFSPVVVSIGGQVTLGAGGLTATAMTLTVGKSLSTSTDGGGNYSFINLPAGRNYTVTPAKAGFGFEPPSRSFTNTLVNQTANFVASATFQFNVGSYTGGETGQRVTITIVRTSGLSGPASVRYGTSDGTALQKSDYILAFGRLNFAAGETSKSFEVLIVDDAYVEGDEFFFVTLSDPVGASLGTPNPAMVTIIDNDTVPPTTNPIDQPRFFVQENYFDFLGRYPDPSGWDFWTNEITSCGTNQQCIDVKRINVSAAYFLSIEFQQTGYLVERMYKASYGDASGTSATGGTHQIPVPAVRFLEFIADAEQIGQGVVVNAPGWETVLENNKQSFASEFVQRSRFTTALPTTLTPAQFVDNLNQKAGSVLSASERTTAINLFGGAGNTSNMTARGQALRQVAENAALSTAEFNRAFVLMQFFGYLRRNPNDAPDADYSGYEFWLAKLNQFGGDFAKAEMVKAFIVSSEYRLRFGPAVVSPPAQLTSITVSPSSASIDVGQTQTVTPQARDQTGATMTGLSFTWASSNGNVASVTNGVVTGVAAGTTGITASSGGVTSNSAALTVTVAAPKASKVIIDKPSVFFPAINQSAQLTARILDQQGAPLAGSVTWTATAPDRVSVDAAGKLIAKAVGSAQIIAEAAGVRSAPTLVIVAELTAGALLVTDAQVVSVGPPLGLAAGEAPGVGTHYEITLQGVAAPAPGTVVLAAETAPIAGKVVATRQDASGLVVTLAIAPLYELFSAYDIALNIDLSAFPVEAVPAQSAQAAQSAVWNAERGGKLRGIAAARPLDDFKPEPFKKLDCDASLKPKLGDPPLQLSPEVNLNLVLDDRPGYSKHALEGSVKLVGTVGIKLQAGFKASGRCDALRQYIIKAGGWYSLIVQPAVYYGFGAELSSEILLVQAELSATGTVGLSIVAGWECGGPTPDCHSLDSITPLNDFKTTSKIPSENDMQAKVSAHFFAVAGLRAGVGKILEGRIGPKQSFDLAFDEDQAARTDYASTYDLKVVGVVEPGALLQYAIKEVIGDDTVAVKFKGASSTDFSESPKGSLSVSKSRVAVRSPVDFTVDLTPDTTIYKLLGYNVTGLELYRKRDDELKFTHWKSMSPVTSYRATYHWVPTEADAGKYEFAAFVNTQLTTPLLEVNPNSIQKVEVSCFSAGGLATKFDSRATLFAMGSWTAPKASTCVDTWVGTAKTNYDSIYVSESQLTLKVDTRVNTGDPDVVQYYAEGTVKVRDLYYESIGCTISPTEFTIDRDTGSKYAQYNQYYIDHRFNPAFFGGIGDLSVTQTVVCPNQAPQTYLILWRFFDSSDRQVPLSADGLTIQESTPEYSFLFTRPSAPSRQRAGKRDD